MSKAMMALIRCYQRYISPLLGSHCRFYPSCSHYALEAFERHGAIKGGGLSFWRLLRCNPWSRGGIDLVPKNLPK